MCSCKRHGDQNATCTCTCSCHHPAPTTPTPEMPDDAARAAARDLGWFTDPELITDAFAAGATWQRAQIAARRDEVAEAARAFIVQEVGDDMGDGMTDQAERLTDAFLAALGVSDR